MAAGQVKLFDQGNHTVKYQDGKGEGHTCTTYVTAWMKYSLEKNGEAVPQWLLDYNGQDNKVSCLFGGHLLNESPDKTIALVEAPKTAIIASAFFPQFLWLATGALSYLTEERCTALKGRKVILFPDLSRETDNKKTAYQLWSEKAASFAHIADFKVSGYLENIANEEQRNKGLDLADWLMGLDYSDFVKGINDRTLPMEIVIDEPDIESMPCCFLYKDYMVQTIRSKQGSYIDVLFDRRGEILPFKMEGYGLGMFCGLKAWMMLLSNN